MLPDVDDVRVCRADSAPGVRARKMLRTAAKVFRKQRPPEDSDESDTLVPDIDELGVSRASKKHKTSRTFQSGWLPDGPTSLPGVLASIDAAVARVLEYTDEHDLYFQKSYNPINIFFVYMYIQNHIVPGGKPPPCAAPLPASREPAEIHEWWGGSRFLASPRAVWPSPFENSSMVRCCLMNYGWGSSGVLSLRTAPWLAGLRPLGYVVCQRAGWLASWPGNYCHSFWVES